MNYARLGNGGTSCQNISEESKCLDLTQRTCFFQLLAKSASLNEFRYNIEICCVFDDLNEFDYICMTNHFKSFDLILKENLGRVVVDGSKIDMLDGNLCTRSTIFSLINLASSSLAKHLLRIEVVVANSKIVALGMVVFFLHFLINWNYIF